MYYDVRVKANLARGKLFSTILGSLSSTQKPFQKLYSGQRLSQGGRNVSVKAAFKQNTAYIGIHSQPLGMNVF